MDFLEVQFEARLSLLFMAILLQLVRSTHVGDLICAHIVMYMPRCRVSPDRLLSNVDRRDLAFTCQL